jgi:hypothetical protein
VIDFTTAMPLPEAVESISRRTPLGTMLRSAELERLPLEIRDAAFFSAQVENERILVAAQKRIQQRVNLERSKLADGKEGVFMDRRRFIDEMRGELGKLGYRPDPAKAGTIQDLTSTGRLGLIWDMNLAQAEGAAAWKTSMSEVALRVEPAMEFVRLEQRMEHRKWPARWQALGGIFYPGTADYPEGRMIALKTSDIWRRLNRFGVPWKPFDWGSGMGTRGVGRREALKLGVIKRGDPPQKAENLPLTTGLQASVKGLPEVSRDRLRSEMGDAIRFDKDALIYNRDTTEANEHRDKTIREELRARARAIAEQGRDQLDGLRSGDDAASWAPESAEELLSSLSAVAVGRKLLYHEQWHGSPEDALAAAQLIRNLAPDHVSVMVRNGHINAWRDDLLELTADEIQALAEGGDNGVPLGYGQDMFVDPFAVVSFRDESGKVVGGFHAPAATATVYARIRQRDFVDALGVAIKVFINQMEVAL